MKLTRKQIIIAICLTALIVVGVLTSFYLKTRYILAIDPQQITCLDGHVFVVDKKKYVPKVGEIFAFTAPKTVSPVYEPGTRMIKRIVAGPGDTVRITPDETIYINDQAVNKGLWHLQGLQQEKKARFFGQQKLKDGEWWFMGDSDWSFDSRYWGVVRTEEIIGEAYVIF